MGKFKQTHRLVLATIASAYMAVSYTLMSAAFTLESFLSYENWGELVNNFITSVNGFSLIFWFAFFGALFWAFSCYLLAASVRGFFRFAITITAVISTVWAGLLFYLAVDFKNIFIDVSYSYDLSHFLARILPYFMTAMICLSLVLFLVALALHFKSVSVSVTSALALSVFAVSAIVFLLNLNRFLPSAFFAVVLPSGFILLAITTLRSAIECKV